MASSQGVQAVAERLKGLDPEAVAQLGVGRPLYADICEALAKPGRDPQRRAAAAAFSGRRL